MNRFAAVMCACSLAVIGTIAVSGCQKGDAADAGGNARVAVVDLDKVATDLGWMKDLEGNLQTLNKQLVAELNHAKDQYDTQIKNKKLEFAPKESDKLTKDQEQLLQGLAQAAQQILNKLQENANAQFNNYRQQSVQQYREAIRPIVQQVAEDKRLWYVSERNASVLYYDPSGDITDSVIDAARAHPPILTPVPVPQLPAPPTIVVNPATQPATAPHGAATVPPKTDSSTAPPSTPPQ